MMSMMKPMDATRGTARASELSSWLSFLKPRASFSARNTRKMRITRMADTPTFCASVLTAFTMISTTDDTTITKSNAEKPSDRKARTLFAPMRTTSSKTKMATKMMLTIASVLL